MKSAAQEDSLIIVVSAVGGVTDQLLACARMAESDGDKAQALVKQIQTRHDQVFGSALQEEKTAQKVSNLFDELGDILKGVSLVRECSLRTLDLVMSFGERLSAQLMTVLLKSRGAVAEYIDARDCVVTDKKHGGARVNLDPTFERISSRIVPSAINVMTGFIARSQDGITTTLGRGGSDYTAALCGAALKVKQVEIWTDVDGFMSADPRMVDKRSSCPG